MHFPISTLLAARTTSLSQYWHKLTDPTFRGIYHANAFDLAMMVPYFLVLFVLAIYGLHRYWLVYDYYKYAKNVPGPPPEVTSWPQVTVQLPIFNERYVIERLVDARELGDRDPHQGQRSTGGSTAVVRGFVWWASWSSSHAANGSTGRIGP